MSTDDKFLDLGYVDDIVFDEKHLPGGFHETLSEFNEYVMPWQDYRKPIQGSFDLTEKAWQDFLSVLREAERQNLILDNIKRLFKPLPHVD